MYNENLFIKFCKERHVKESTINGYQSAIRHYLKVQEQSLEYLIKEALTEEEQRIPLKDRKLKIRLINYRNYLFKCKISSNTLKTYLQKIKTIYSHFEVTIPKLPEFQFDCEYEINYLDLPSKDHIRQALDICSIDLKAIILFMSSSGTAKAETLSLSVGDFINATQDYHQGGSINYILDSLNNRNDVVPTFYLRRIKTDKYYYTFCSPEATSYIVKYLKTRKDLKLSDKLFDFSSSKLMLRFQEINDQMNWGFKGNYRFFRTHALRKYHASNIGLSSEYIDNLQGRSKNIIHETYIKTNPKKLKKIYMAAMDNIMINENREDVVNQEFTIIVNVFLSGKEYNIL